MDQRALILISLTLLHFTYADDYRIPEIRIEILSPKGLRMSIPDAPGIGLFALQININKIIASPDVGQLFGEILAPKNGRWTYENLEIEFQIGDTLNYYVFVAVNGSGYLKDNLSYKVTAIGTVNVHCKPSETRVQRKGVCSGETIFFEDFNTLDTFVWQREHKIPIDHPEYPFNSYQMSAVEVVDGNLQIKPTVQQNHNSFTVESIFTGQLDLSNWCTGIQDTCKITASGINILPPVVSGRITAKNFAFKYGIVEIRAKLPKGDWLYPELILQPFIHKYGTAHYVSGLIKMASARGNDYLVSSANETLGNQILYGGPIFNSVCRDSLLRSLAIPKGSWGDDFHIYKLKWEPDRMSLSVDNKEFATYAPQNNLRESIPDCHHFSPELASGTKMAPFDQEFILSIGLAAGGVSEFPDGSRTFGNRKKPWRNVASKAKLHFWEDISSWFSTWSDNSSLLVDYVKITAL